jgi:hypothetical protein
LISRELCVFYRWKTADSALKIAITVLRPEQNYLFISRLFADVIIITFKVTLEQAMKAQMGSQVIAIPFH